MKAKFLMGILVVAVASVAVGSTNIRQSAEFSPPEPKAIVFYK